MKKRLLSRSASIFGVVALIIALTGCNIFGGGDDTPPCPEDTTPLKQQVQTYLEQKQVAEVNHQFASGYSAYFDLSNGMPHAYEISENKANLESVSKMITANSSEWTVYSLASDKITPMDFSSQNDVYKSVTEAQYTEIKAPIQNALKNIVSEDKLALLVTDFEEYQTSDIKGKPIVYQYPYAKDSFKAWLLKGGVIKFYVMNYVEPQNGHNLDKKLFFVVFDNKDMELSKRIDDQFKLQNAQGYETYVLKRESFSVYNEYKGGNGGNYEGDFDPMVLKEYGLFEDVNAEYYKMGNKWNEVFKHLYEAKDKDESCEGLLSKLYIDLSDQESRSINKLELKVTDITDDLEAYSQYVFAMGFEPQAGDSVDSEAACFFDQDGKILSDYEYEPIKMEPINKKLLVINQDVFDNSRKESPEKTKIVIDFDKLFYEAFGHDEQGYDWTNEDVKEVIESFEGKVLRVDVCVADASFNDNQRLKELFDFRSNVWETKNNNNNKELGDFVPKKLNDCISQSIQQVYLDPELNYKGKVIYTYIIIG